MTPATHDTILEMRGITKRFPGVVALDDVNFAVERGEIHAICGENGAGKSTLMKVLSGVHPHGTYEGQILLDGEEVTFSDIKASEAAGIAIIHQELTLSPFLSIAENIFLGNERSTHGVIDWHKTNTAAREIMARVGLTDKPSTRVQDIGVGKQQLVEIAKALSKDVRLLILDEPTAALNDDDSAHLLALMRQLQERGITCIIISHKLGEIREIADSTTVIRDGRTIATLDMHREDGVSESEIIRLMVGRALDQRFPDHISTVGGEALRLEGWTVHHPADPERIVVDDANLVLNHGEIVGLAGLMGAGRTELAMSLFGRSWGSDISGKVFKDGRQIEIGDVTSAIAHGIAYVSEDRKRYGLNLIDSIKRNVSSASPRRFSRRGVLDLHEERAIVSDLCGQMAVKAPTIESVVGGLSGGNQQKVVLAKWVAAEPDVLILDEPTRGIDVGAKYEIYQIINELADAGKAVLVISSELPELLGICDRIYTLSAGRITADLPRRDADQEILMRHMTQIKEN
ncbi:multiple monosaccharide ABC transporter ATP-binding protein [Actinomyces sp. MRS3W]|uniref:multiple monosaccharide ABC transporter ATP-binding protein n=1 Tax=Actinomyces sp. MRS3W TaxID=2800796 RepID=UPI0028FDB319|nr:multiple monosaccharide ABC transporter ATP-binding protein [Actinomyces sp. MRS3W]MDU0348737.1 multiple monosaccharide ABC transporter ATP-binding protein [Actinomyces sp. MRS3W]